MQQFETLCFGKSNCDIFVRNMDWPAECGEKIGLRQNVVTIPITRYKNITETIRIEKIKYPDLPDIVEEVVPI